jgi:hypothetical protein
MLNDQLTE